GAAEEARPAPWSADEHLRRLGVYGRLGGAGAAASAARGPDRQRPRRALEQQVRLGVAALLPGARALGRTLAAMAEGLQMAARTLRQWVYDCGRGPRPVAWLGRPPRRAPWAVRRQVLEVLDELGPGLGLPTLREIFP